MMGGVSGIVERDFSFAGLTTVEYPILLIDNKHDS
jgi:hypothetical protein